MGRVAIVTDSASDLTAVDAATNGIRIVPLYVRFGDEEFRAGVELTTDAFWTRMTAPDAPFPTTAAASPGDFQAAFEDELAKGADAIVCVTVGSKLSATHKSAELAAQGMRGAEIHVVDSDSASMGIGLLALLGAEMAADGIPAAEIAATLRGRVGDIDLYVALDTLEYLRKGGRMSPARAAIGTVLSIKPIITVTNGEVEAADRVRTRAKARERASRWSGSRSSTPRRRRSTPSARRCSPGCPVAWRPGTRPRPSSGRPSGPTSDPAASAPSSSSPADADPPARRRHEGCGTGTGR
jgi:DegV family protein with EDD domain